VGKRNLETAMQERTDLEFEVRWYPFQLNPNAPPETNKLEGYMKKFNASRQQCLAMAQNMQQRFKAAGLPYNFSETDKSGNTFDAHVLHTAAWEHGGAAAQDKVAERLFHSYFSEGNAPSDPTVLRDVAAEVGIDPAAVLQASSEEYKKTKEELKYGRKLGVTGVPHFVIYAEDGARKKLQVSGAQPPDEFAAVFEHISRARAAAEQNGYPSVKS
jgi:predicted DsbA family dithiol-disulfide isomerase